MRIILTIILALISTILTSCAPAYAAPSRNVSINTYIPEKAIPLLPIVKAEAIRVMPNMLTREYFGGLGEQESCLSLLHSRCWSTLSELNTSKELGIGIFQITKAYNKDGSIRMDALTDLRNRHMDELKELSWSNVRQRPDLQIRAMMIMTNDNYKALYRVKDPIQRLKMADAAYNGGYGGLNKERIACGVTKSCDPGIWDNNVERYCLKSKRPLYGTRSPCDINREHVKLVWVRMPKYSPYLN